MKKPDQRTTLQHKTNHLIFAPSPANITFYDILPNNECEQVTAFSTYTNQEPLHAMFVRTMQKVLQKLHRRRSAPTQARQPLKGAKQVHKPDVIIKTLIFTRLPKLNIDQNP